MTMKTIAVIQARMGSERLPGKVLADLGGRSLIETIVARVAGAAVSELWVATSTLAEDEPVARLAQQRGLRVHRGHPTDVLARFLDVVALSRPDWIVRLTADNPFVDRAVVDALVAEAAAASPSEAMVWEDPQRRTMPLGYVPQLVRAGALLEAGRAIPADQSYHRVHVTSWTLQQSPLRAWRPGPAWPARPEQRWTVDEPQDLAFARALLARAVDPLSSYARLVSIVDEHPELSRINDHVAQKELSAG